MKKISLFVFCFLMTFVFSMNLDALEGYTTDSGIRVRSEPTVNSQIIDTIIKTETTLDVVEEKLYNVGDSDCSSGWYKINYNNAHRYICGLYVSLGKTPGSISDEINTEGYEARIGANDVYVRVSTYMYSDGVRLLPGTNIIVLKDKVSSDEKCPDGRSLIRYYDNKTGYVCSTYIDKKEDITSIDSAYEQELKGKGFPDTYIPYLVYLHKKHPSWVFNAINTNLYWENVISGEEGKQYIQTGVANYVINFNPAEGTDWFKANNAVNAFYLDPRNFLTERFIFQFENLNYLKDETKTTPDEGEANLTKNGVDKNSNQTKKYYNTVSNIFAESYLNTEEYIYDYIDAGYKYNVSPLHLASRSRKEGATKSDYVAVTGTVSDETYAGYSLYGYYNMFNIGAYNDRNTSGPVYTGLAYACGSACTFYDTYERPWNTIEKAIYGGTHFISDGYISAGQNTIYFEKFNTSPTSNNSAYTHQYQTNVLAPCSEGEITYDAYADQGLLEEAFVFDIPVYLDMPLSVSLPSIASQINTLKSISIDGRVINGFDSDILSYDIKVNKKTNSIKVTTVKNDEKSKVSGDGDIKLDKDEMSINIVVTSESGVKKTYTINIVKIEDVTTVSDILSKLTYKSDNNILFNVRPGSSAGDMESTIKGQNANAIVAIRDDKNNAVASTDKVKTGYKIQILAPSGDNKEFLLSIIGDPSGDGDVTILDLLKVQKHILNSSKLEETFLKAADTNGDGEVTILDLLRIQKVLKNELTF